MIDNSLTLPKMHSLGEVGIEQQKYLDESSHIVLSRVSCTVDSYV